MEKNFHTLNIRELSLDDIEELVHVLSCYIFDSNVNFLWSFFFKEKLFFML